MKYFGEKSLSSVLGVLLRISWFLTLVIAILSFIMLTHALLSENTQTSLETEYGTISLIKLGPLDFSDFRSLRSQPLWLRLVILPYFWVVVGLLLGILWKTRQLFDNFRRELIFDRGNVELLGLISKLVIGFSVATFNFTSLAVGLLLLVLTAIFKNGLALQEEHDYTV